MRNRNKRPPGHSKREKCTLLLPPEVLNRVDDYVGTGKPFPYRSQAIEAILKFAFASYDDHLKDMARPAPRTLFSSTTAGIDIAINHSTGQITGTMRNPTHERVSTAFTQLIASFSHFQTTNQPTT